MPKVSVLMPVYNGEQFLREAIDSILSQVYKDFEFIIIDDASTDNSPNIIQSYRDPRIRYFRNSTNLLQPTTMNVGIQKAVGKYIARMDSDDISLPLRLKLQVEFMEANPTICASGTAAKVIGQKTIWNNPQVHDEINSQHLFYCSLTHPTVIFNRELLDKHKLYYNPERATAEDYDLWVRMGQKTFLANIPQVLLEYRLHPNQLSAKFASYQNMMVEKIQFDYLEQCGLKPTKEDFVIHRNIAQNIFPQSKQESALTIKWYNKIIDKNKETKYFSQIALEKVISNIKNHFGL